ncbi:hypothetical protein ACTL6P_12625 [Endozoicomonas acroporae]|uniref:hypothetical protein n=1 Tax=Endozoicomonas acroporae TaxID=1701104 RepID=UPI0011AFC1E3|nr:hypothetical protein [Endozoicomonas acroporae]
MEKLEIQSPQISLDQFGKYFQCADGRLRETDCKTCGNTLKEITGVCDLNNFYQGEYHQSLNKGFRHFRHPDSIHAGQLDDGMFFLKLLNPSQCEWQYKLDHHRQNIQYLGVNEFEVFPGTHPYSLYCGKTLEEALATFEQACQGTDIATFIRPLLGFGSDSFSAILEAQKPKVPERPPEDPVRIAIAEEDMSLF